jgi:hypothetical protein
MRDEMPWGNDDQSWWQQMDEELQQQEEAERIAKCDAALAELRAIIEDELMKIYRSMN